MTPEALDTAIRALGLDVERVGAREWVVAVPLDTRGPLAVRIVLGDHTVFLRTFLLRRPDRGTGEIHGRLLRRNLGTRLWRFALDDAGDVHMAADVPVNGLAAETLDAALGTLATEVDEIYEAIVRAGFDVPAGTRFAPPPTPA